MGADALRFSLLAAMESSHTIKLDLSRVVANRLLCNKAWQAAKFACMYLPSPHDTVSSAAATGGGSLATRWILSRLYRAATSCDHVNTPHPTPPPMSPPSG